MKKTIITMLFIFIIVASFTLAIEEPIPTNAQETDAVACCMAMTASCLACVEGISVEDYCAQEPNAIGCEELQGEEPLLDEQQKEAQQRIKQAIQEEIEGITENDVYEPEALAKVYREQARELVQTHQENIQEIVETYRARNAEELDAYIQARKELHQQKQEQLTKQATEQNEVQIAVHSIIAMEHIAGERGFEISSIARTLLPLTDEAKGLKEETTKRKAVAKFFSGGTQTLAVQLQEEAKLFEEQIQELIVLREEANLDQEVQTIFDEQIQTLEEEQHRLEQLAKKESKRGLFGWLWKNKISFE